MAKKAKYTLEVETDFDFDLIGISCHQTDYRLCWGINNQQDLKMEKAAEPFMIAEKKGKNVSKHSLYEWEDEENFRAYYLIKNKAMSKFLIPEHKQLDYFLIIKGVELNIDVLLTQLKEIKGILTAVILDPNELKSSDNLIF